MLDGVSSPGVEIEKFRDKNSPCQSQGGCFPPSDSWKFFLLFCKSGVTNRRLFKPNPKHRNSPLVSLSPGPHWDSWPSHASESTQVWAPFPGPDCSNSPLKENISSFREMTIFFCSELQRMQWGEFSKCPLLLLAVTDALYTISGGHGNCEYSASSLKFVERIWVPHAWSSHWCLWRWTNQFLLKLKKRLLPWIWGKATAGLGARTPENVAGPNRRCGAPAESAVGPESYCAVCAQAQSV